MAVILFFFLADFHIHNIHQFRIFISVFCLEEFHCYLPRSNSTLFNQHTDLTSENGPTSSKHSPSPGGPGSRPWREIYGEESDEGSLCREKSW